MIRSIICIGVISASTYAGDWPQLLGPERNGTAPSDEKLLTTWPSGGPEKTWSIDIGQGFAGPVIQDQLLLVFHRNGNKERVDVFDTETRQSRWETEWPAEYRGGINPDAGPRATPTIHNKVVFAMGASGRLVAMTMENGEILWERNTAREFRAQEGYFGFGSSPIASGNKVIVNIGGDTGGIVAFDEKTGETAWTLGDYKASYSSPVTTTLQGKPAIICVTRLHVVAVEADTGNLIWEIPFGARGPTVNGAAPIVLKDRLFLTASYRIGAEMHKLTGSNPTKIWSSDRSLSSQYASVVAHDGFIYGTHGREDIPPAHFRCIDANTGAIKWSADDHGVTHVLRVRDHLLLLTIEGQLSVVKANPAKYEPIVSAKITDEGTRAVPALANGILYLRTTNDGESGKLLAFQVGTSP